MPYTSTSWVDGSTALNQSHLNNLETQYTEATNSFEQDLFTGFVFSGLVATKDGTVANKLDVTAGVAFLKQTDNTLRRRAPASSNQTTATPSTTYYLDLNPDGTWSWATSHTGQANYLPICQVTTDGSGNILAVTDERLLNATFLNGMAGQLDLPVLYNGLTVATGATSLDNGGVTTSGTGILTTTGSIIAGTSVQVGSAVSGIKSNLNYAAASNAAVLTPPKAGATAQGIVLQSWDGAATHNPLSIGGQYGLAASWVDNSGNFNGPSVIGNGGTLPVSSQQSGSANGVYVQTWSGSAAMIPFSIGGQYNSALSWVDSSGNFNGHSLVGNNGTLPVSSQQSGSANGIYFKSWSGSAAVTSFSVGGQYNSALSWVDGSGNFNGPAGGGVPVTRNNAASSVPIYTGTTSPTNPPTGSIWVKA